MVVEITVKDAAGQPIAGVEVSIVNNVTGLVSSRISDGGGYTNHAVGGAAGHLCTLTTNGYAFTGSSAAPPEGPNYYRLAGDAKVTLTAAPFKKPVVVVVRAPLPAFDPDSTDPQTGASLPVHKTLMVQPPATPDNRFMRANLWGTTIPNLEAIPGGASGAAQNRMLTYLAHHYTVPSLNAGIKRQAECGYSHWWMSPPDSLGAGQSLDDFVGMCKRVQDGGIPHVCHLMRSKDIGGPNHNPDPTLMAPVIERLLRENVIAMEAPAWEASLFNSPEHYRTLVEHDAALLLPHGVIMGHHLQAGYAHFGPNITDGPKETRGIRSARAFWLPSLQLGVKRLYWQADPAWTAGMMQARGTDVSARAIAGGAWGLPESFDWDAFELCGVPLFTNGVTGDGRLATEDTADLLSFEVLCAPGPRPPSGFGNGCRRQNGTML